MENLGCHSQITDTWTRLAQRQQVLTSLFRETQFVSKSQRKSHNAKTIIRGRSLFYQELEQNVRKVYDENALFYYENAVQRAKAKRNEY